MREILKEYTRNKKESKINIIILTFSIILCFMFLSYVEQTILSDSLVNLKSQNIKYIKPKLNEGIIEDLIKDSNIKYFYITYDFPDELEEYFDEEVEEDMQRSLLSFYKDKSKDKLDVFEIMIPAKINLKRDIKINDKIRLYNNDFKIVDFTKTSLLNSFIISFDSAKRLNLDPLTIDVVLQENISDKGFVDTLDRLEKKVNSDNYELGSTLKLPIEETALISLGQLILVSVINVIFIFMNILHHRTKQYFIYRFSGMTKWQFYKLILFEVLLDFIISFALAYIIFMLFNEFLIKEILGIMRYQFRYKFIAYIFVGYFVLYIVLIIIGIRKYFNKSLMESYKS